MKHTALALVLFAAASSAHANGVDASSGLRCGVILGGRSLAYDAGEATKQRQDRRLNAMRGTASAEPLRFAPSAGAPDSEAASVHAASNTPDRRLPANLTLATIGCSWR